MEEQAAAANQECAAQTRGEGAKMKRSWQKSDEAITADDAEAQQNEEQPLLALLERAREGGWARASTRKPG